MLQIKLTICIACEITEQEKHESTTEARDSSSMAEYEVIVLSNVCAWEQACLYARVY